MRVGGLVVLVVLASVVAYKLGLFDYRHATEHIAQLRRSHNPIEFAILFVTVYGIGTSIGVPAFPFTVAGGVLFGTMLGTGLSWVGAMIGSAGSYWIARTIGHDIVRRWMARFRWLNAAREESRDFAGMLRLRVLPVLPLAAASFAEGLAKAPFGRFFVASAIGVLPMIIIYSYFADSLVEGISSGHGQALTSLLVASALLIGLSLAPRLVKSR